ncbi:MAG: nucleotidyl transferase AbiEii/AbiGii toxin family protein [Candidatus Thermoplasmatota archaeon]
MIPENEIKAFARTFEIPASTIERDYAQNWLLAFLPTMALKGGTGLQKCYFKNYRFSDDLDFTLLEPVPLEKMKKQINDTINKVKNEAGINFSQQIETEEVENGYLFVVYFRILRKTGDPLKIKLDITKKENECIMTPVQQKTILQTYSDRLDIRTTVYSLEEMFAEKTRALFERTRPRDLYDVWYLRKNTTFDSELFKKKCEFRHLTLDINDIISRKQKFENAWKNSLQHQMKNLPNVKMVFDDVVLFLRKYI